VDDLKVTLAVHYTEEYPDQLPELSLEAIDGTLEDSECEALLADLRRVGDENLGMAMTFTLVSHLREQLSSLVLERAELQKREAAEKERLVVEAEEARTRGTPVTIESFKAWKTKFDREIAQRKAREEDERLKGLTNKERDEWKKAGTRFSGRQLFERSKNLDHDDDSLLEEGTVSVDFSQYDRSERHLEEEEEDQHVHFSDSD